MRPRDGRPLRRLGPSLALLLAAVVLTASPAHAAEIKALSAGAVRSIVTDLAESYQRETGNTVTFTFGTAGMIRQKLAAGEAADVVIVTDVGIDESIRQGVVAAGTRTDLGRTAMGIAVREGAPRPDIGTPEALRQTLLAVSSLVYTDPASGATSGTHFAGVLERLGIADAVKAKTRLVPGGYPAELVAKGEVELVAHQISEIVPVKGVLLVGPLPKELQKYTVYAAGVVARSGAPETARAFVTYLARPSFRPRFAAAGLDYRD